VSEFWHRHMTQRVDTDPHWRVNCMAYAGAMVINDATIGGLFGVTGQNVRKYSDEPTPDPGSPGLNITQIVNVARDRYRVNLANRTGSDWNAMLHELQAGGGRRIFAAIEYRELGDYRCQAGGDFAHAIVIIRSSPNALLVSDPLCSSAKWMSKSAVNAAMVAMAKTTGHGSGFLWWGMSRPVPRIA
jgi:hypothetical protein